MHPHEQTTQTREAIAAVFDSLKIVLLEKNRRYGNSALVPLGVFTAHIGGEDVAGVSLLARLDDKLARIANAGELRENDVADLIGYLVLLCIQRGWTDFSHLVD